jgi:hypothetical protein
MMLSLQEISAARVLPANISTATAAHTIRVKIFPCSI